MTVSDGVNSSTETLTISVQNILEDFIDYSFSISDGTLSEAPVLTVNATIDSLTQAQKVYVDLQSVAVTPITVNNGAFDQTIYPNCSGSIAIYEMTKNDATSWSLNQSLSSELSDLCEYGVNFYINLHDTDSESSPPTDGIHLQSGNKRLLDNTSQYSMFYQPNPGYDSDDLISISNPRADSTRDTTNGQVGVLIDPGDNLLYIWSSTQSYPENCSTDSYTFTVSDELGIEETINTPTIAQFDSSCVAAVMQNQSSDPNKVEFNLGLYSVEPFGNNLYSYIRAPFKQTQGSTSGNGGVTSPEFLIISGTINSTDRRKATLSFEFDKAFLPEVIDDSQPLGHLAYLYIEADDESGIKTKTANQSFVLDVAGSDADITAPKIDNVTISDYSNNNYPQRNYKKFEVDFTNDTSLGGALTSVKDIWLSIKGGPECRSEVIYVRDELDGKISTDSTTATVTRPFLKQNEGTYIIEGMNINDHGYAEYYYGNTGNDIHPVIGTTFTVGDGSAASCPIFTQNYGTGAISVNVDENTKTIGTFAATGSSGDTIVYSIENTFTAANGVSIYDLVEIDTTTGALSYINSPDYEGDTTYSGGVMVVATSTLNPNIKDYLSVTVNIQNLNDNAPVFTSSSTFTVDENQTSIGCITLNDDDLVAPTPTPGGCAIHDTISLSVTGDNLQMLNSDGTLAFINAPDYETKSSYTGTITANDGVFTATQDVTININDLNDNDPVVGNSSFTVNENQSVVGQVSVTDPDTNNTFTYSIVSDYEDGAKFAIDSDGNITFVNNPDYETQSSYKLKVNISDGQTTVVQEYTVTLNDVIAEAIPTTASLNLLPKTTNSSTIQLQSSVVDGRSPGFTLVSDGSLGTSSLNEISGQLTYETSSTVSGVDVITFKVDDGQGNESSSTLTINLKTDPLYKYQWHLVNTGQTNFASGSGTSGEDLNIVNAISSGYTGSGVVVSVMDEGLEITHEDLADNVLSGKSYNFLNSSNDPTSTNVDGDHGTSVAGIIASKGWNNKGGRGVAPNASLVGFNVLESSNFTSDQAWSWGLDNTLVSPDIFNMSYGTGYATGRTTFNFPTQNLPSAFNLSALENGINNLRDGKGAIYVKSMGNNFRRNATNGTACGQDDSEFTDTDGAMGCFLRFIDSRHTIPYIIGVAALDADGIKTTYSTSGPSIWVSGFGGEYGYDSNLGWNVSGTFREEPAILTTDQSGCTNGYVGSNGGSQRNNFNNNSGNNPENANCNYTSTFNGTSSAAPSVAGGIAVLLEAFPSLTWREVKHVIANSARKIDASRSYARNGITQYEWETNAAGYNFHNWYGFGAFDLDSAITFATNLSSNYLGTSQKGHGSMYQKPGKILFYKVLQNIKLFQ